LLVCSSCHEGYCSTEHQVADWNYHKVQCKQRKKEKKKEIEKEKEKEKESDAAITYLLLNPPVAARPTAAGLFESLYLLIVNVNNTFSLTVTNFLGSTPGSKDVIVVNSIVPSITILGSDTIHLKRKQPLSICQSVSSE
jgi:hypothetical protein